MGRLDQIAEAVSQAQATTQAQASQRKRKKKEDPRVAKTRSWVLRIAGLIEELKAETVDKTKRDKLDLIAEYVSLIVEENELLPRP